MTAQGGRSGGCRSSRRQKKTPPSRSWLDLVCAATGFFLNAAINEMSSFLSTRSGDGGISYARTYVRLGGAYVSTGLPVFPLFPCRDRRCVCTVDTYSLLTCASSSPNSPNSQVQVQAPASASPRRNIPNRTASAFLPSIHPSSLCTRDHTITEIAP
jgi:hypothetical protein